MQNVRGIAYLDVLSRDLEEAQEGGCSSGLLSAAELRVQLGDKEQELDRAKEALQDSDSVSSLTHQSLSDGEDQMDRLRQAELTRNTPMTLWRAGAVQAWLELDHYWVACSWLADVGLPQYAQSFREQLVDGRVLGSLSRRDLELQLGVSERFHQSSLLLAVQLLQQLGFDKEALQVRRAKCEQQDCDPVVWTCRRVMKWIRDIDLRVGGGWVMSGWVGDE
ncbi:hypothetical protein CRUP_022050 [Coryphaenoides rupestris]|nr:hypothetical protein CRUP_022050 [Coryphaenoides rupestris]